MRTARITFALLLVAILSLGSAAAVGAQDQDYPPTTPTSEVLDETDEINETDDGEVGSVGTDVAGGEQPEVLGSQTSRLPVTGGDLVGLAVLGTGAVVLGAVLVVRRRHADA